MINRITSVACILMSVLLVTAMAPSAEAGKKRTDGKVTIYNQNCTKLLGFKIRKRVTVNVYDDEHLSRCTNTSVTIDKGSRKTVSLRATVKGKSELCKYQVEPKGTIFGIQDVASSGNTSVTCKKDKAGICMCRAD